MTLDELKARQGWPLTQKIDHAIMTIETFIARSGRPAYVAFSGGKDSTVLLDIVRRYLPSYDIPAVFCNTGNEWPEIVRFVKSIPDVVTIHPEKPVREVLAAYGFPLLSKQVAHDVRQLQHTKSAALLHKRVHGTKRRTGQVPVRWQYLRHAPFDISEKCCDYLKKRPFYRYEKQTGRAPILGVMACESRLRMSMYLRRGGCNSFDEHRPACYPLSIWTDADIWEYIRRYSVPYSEIYDRAGVEQTGCMFCGFGAHLEKGDNTRFARLYALHPQMYCAMMRYSNKGVTYRRALHYIGVSLPDENRQGDLFAPQETPRRLNGD